MIFYFYLTAAIAAVSFVLFHVLCARTKANRRALLLLSTIIGVPGLLMLSNNRFGFPGGSWLHDIQTLPAARVQLGLLGAPLAVVLASRRLKSFRYGDHARLILTVMLMIVVAFAYLPQILGPMDFSTLSDRWDGDVCLQTSSSTCMPACLATMLRLNGTRVTERQIAEALGTSSIGTDDWCVKQGLGRLGYEAHFGWYYSLEGAPVPCVLSVLTPEFIPHVVVLLNRSGGKLTIGEPLQGRLTYGLDAFRAAYRPNGSYITVTRIEDP